MGALEVGDEEEVEDLRTDAQLERRIQEVGMGDVVSRELERKAEARRHKEDQRHLAQHNLRFSRVNLSNVRKSDHWNSDCEDMVDNWPSKEERVNELNKGLQLIKVKLDQRLGRSPSAAKSPKKQRKSRNISEEEGSSNEAETKGHKADSKVAKIVPKKTLEGAGKEKNVTDVESNRGKKKNLNRRNDSDASDLEAEINKLESEVKELKEVEKVTEKEDSIKHPAPKSKAGQSAKKADKSISN